MKYYVLMTSLALLAGTALGYWNGKGAARAEFVSACTRTTFTTVYDYSSDEHRRFHCFEMDESGENPEPHPGIESSEQWVYFI